MTVRVLEDLVVGEKLALGEKLLVASNQEAEGVGLLSGSVMGQVFAFENRNTGQGVYQYRVHLLLLVLLVGREMEGCRDLLLQGLLETSRFLMAGLAEEHGLVGATVVLRASGEVESVQVRNSLGPVSDISGATRGAGILEALWI